MDIFNLQENTCFYDYYEDELKFLQELHDGISIGSYQNINLITEKKDICTAIKSIGILCYQREYDIVNIGCGIDIDQMLFDDNVRGCLYCENFGTVEMLLQANEVYDNSIKVKTIYDEYNENDYVSIHEISYLGFLMKEFLRKFSEDAKKLLSADSNSDIVRKMTIKYGDSNAYKIIKGN